MAKIEIPDRKEQQRVQDFLKKVADEELSFWVPNIQQQVTKEEAFLFRSAANYGVYLCLVLDDAEIHHKILHRFARVALYELSLQGYTAEILTQNLQGITWLADGQALQKQIESYISAGSRYANLARKLGGYAALFFLPQSVGSSL